MPMSDERKLRSARAGEMVSLPFLLLPRTPSSSLLSLPCADAQGWNSTLLDNARKFRMKFTVADPFASFCLKQYCAMKRTFEFNFYNLLSAVQYDDVYGKMGIVATYLDALQDADNNSGC